MADEKWYWSWEQKLDARAGNLESALADAAIRERSERDRLAKRQGSLEQRLDRLTDAVHWLLELSDLRHELDFFSGAEAARRQVRSYLALLGVVGPPRAEEAPVAAPPVPDDPPDYWLPPAARALAALLAGGDLDANVEVKAARQWDRDRTDRFLALCLTLAGQGPRVVQLLPALLGPMDPAQVTVGQRTLWQAAAAGAFGPAGVREILACLEPASQSWPTSKPGEIRPHRWTEAALQLAPGIMRAPNLLPAATLQAFDEPIRAARALVALARGARLLRPPEGDPPGAAVTDPVRSVLQGLLVALVDEGTAAEAPLLRRVESLRGKLHPDGDTQGPGVKVLRADQTLGALDKLLQDDALAAAPDDSAMCWMAWQLARSQLAGIVEELATTAARLPAEGPSVTHHIGDHRVVITGDPLGPEVEALADAAAERMMPSPDGLMGRFRDDVNAAARQRERRRLLDRAEQVRSSVDVVRAAIAGLNTTESLDGLRQLLASPTR
jgi:hypothetical protein